MIQYNMIDNETDFVAQYEDINEIMKNVFPDAIKDERNLGRTKMVAALVEGTRVDISYRGSETAVLIHESDSKIKDKLEQQLNVRFEEFL